MSMGIRRLIIGNSWLTRTTEPIADSSEWECGRGTNSTEGSRHSRPSAPRHAKPSTLR